MICENFTSKANSASEIERNGDDVEVRGQKSEVSFIM
jgi:hypothetical protein